MTINKNQYYIVRGNRSGVFAGNIKEQNGAEVTMTNVRCLWYWDGAASLLQMAAEGVKYPEKCKFTMTVTEATIIDAIEILPCSEKAEKIIKEVGEWKR